MCSKNKTQVLNDTIITTQNTNILIMSAWNKKDSILVQIYKENTPAIATIKPIMLILPQFNMTDVLNKCFLLYVNSIHLNRWSYRAKQIKHFLFLNLNTDVLLLLLNF